jgi:hypothetical protein
MGEVRGGDIADVDGAVAHLAGKSRWSLSLRVPKSAALGAAHQKEPRAMDGGR